MSSIKIGQMVHVVPEWQDEGDDQYIFTALSEPNVNGNFKCRVEDIIKTESSFSTVMELNVLHVEDGDA